MRKKKFILLGILLALVTSSLCFIWVFDNKANLESLNVNVSPKAISDDPCVYLQPTDRELTAEEAVAAAECFIIQNGYTDLPPIADRSKLTPENVWGLTDDEGMKMRHDSLERKAHSYERNAEFFGGSWVIMFRYKPHPRVVEFYGNRLDYVGRAVVMNLEDKRIRIQHSDYPLTSPRATIVRTER